MFSRIYEVVMLPSFSQIYRSLLYLLNINSRQINFGNFYPCRVTAARKFNRNADIDWSVLLFHIRGVSNSNFNSVTSNPDKGFR
jgi:hypothetical protein